MHVMRRLLTTRVRLAPSFLIIGAQRAGTTSLYHYLCQHPAQKHFGVAPGVGVKSIAILWPNGTRTVKRDPEVRRYHHFEPPQS